MYTHLMRVATRRSTPMSPSTRPRLAAGSLQTAIGLEGPLNPAVRRAAQLVAFGANLLTISVGHTLDLVEAVLGSIVEVDARMEILWPTVKLTDVGEESSRETADHINVLGKTRSGAVVTADINAGVAPQDVRSSFEIRGSEGWLSLTSDHPYSFQAGDLKLTSNVCFETPEDAAISGGLMGAAINVGEVYAHLVRDVQAGTYSTPGFEHAVHNARLIEAVRRAADRGERQRVTSEKS